MTHSDCPPELRRLGRTLGRWHTPIVSWHRARVTNGPTEAINNLVKRVKRAAFGFRRFAHYRIRALLYAADPTGRYSPPSLPAENRSANKPHTAAEAHQTQRPPTSTTSMGQHLDDRACHHAREKVAAVESSAVVNDGAKGVID